MEIRVVALLPRWKQPRVGSTPAVKMARGTNGGSHLMWGPQIRFSRTTMRVWEKCEIRGSNTHSCEVKHCLHICTYSYGSADYIDKINPRAPLKILCHWSTSVRDAASLYRQKCLSTWISVPTLIVKVQASRVRALWEPWVSLLGIRGSLPSMRVPKPDYNGGFFYSAQRCWLIVQRRPFSTLRCIIKQS